MDRKPRLNCLVLLLPGLALVCSCSSYTLGTTQSAKAAAFVYVGTTSDGSGAGPSSKGPSILTFSVGKDGRLLGKSALTLSSTEQFIAANSNFAFTVDPSTLRMYAVGPDGTLGVLATAVEVTGYDGSACGSPSGSALMDRSEQQLFIELWSPQIVDGDPSDPCDAWQSYRLMNDGLVFEGDDDRDPWAYHGEALPLGIAAMSGNNRFAYGVLHDNAGATRFTMMVRQPTGALALTTQFAETDPAPAPTGDQFYPWIVAADSSNHLAAVMYLPFTANPNWWNVYWLASYTIDNNTGGISSANTILDMPKVSLSSADTVSVSPGDDFVAVGGNNGLQIFHFNGGDHPLTSDGEVLLSGAEVKQVAWDKQHHLYALASMNSAEGTAPRIVLYVYSVTSGGVVQISGSPWDAPRGSKLIVVSRP